MNKTMTRIFRGEIFLYREENAFSLILDDELADEVRGLFSSASPSKKYDGGRT